MNRRKFLQCVGASSVALTSLPRLAGRALAVAPEWRTYEVTMTVELAAASGPSRAWLPLPLRENTDYQKLESEKWDGNASAVRIHRDEKYDAGILTAEWNESEKAPRLELVTRFATRDRSVDVSKLPKTTTKDLAPELRKYLEPTKLIPTDGIIRETAERIAKPHATDVEKARAIYDWIVENTFRDPNVKGCGLGDVKTLLESRYFGGKCADLNALFVGLARASGIPARDVYGMRAAESKEFKSLGKSGDVTKGQHCRAEFHVAGFGWVPVDPADVRKVVLEEPPGNLALDSAPVARAREKLFGQWEMNYLCFNHAHDLELPGSSGRPLAFLMYPQAETAAGRKDCLDPATFEYRIASREITAA